MKFRDALWFAQDGKCWICSGRMHKAHGFTSPDQATLDHVWPKRRIGNLGDIGLTLLAHHRCNSERGAVWPTDEEVRRFVRIYRKLKPITLQNHLDQLASECARLERVKLRRDILALFAGVRA